MNRRVTATAMAIAWCVAIAGCGLGPGPGTSDVTLTVTRDFGSRLVGRVVERHVPGSETVMRMLERHFEVATKYGGGFVEQIAGYSGSSTQRDWFYYVNGSEAARGSAGTAVHRGDHIWWDLHDWSAADHIPAVVGSFPEPFVSGSGGRRLPTVLECARDVEVACTRVTDELGKLGIPVANQLLGTGSGTDSVTLEVGTWRELRGQIVVQLIEQGPGSSGVYARFTGSGRQLELLDPHGRSVRTLAAGAGLVAATAQGSGAPTWLVTGTDRAGVADAAQALTPTALRDHFALAVQSGRALPLPVNGAS